MLNEEVLTTYNVGRSPTSYMDWETPEVPIHFAYDNEVNDDEESVRATLNGKEVIFASDYYGTIDCRVFNIALIHYDAEKVITQSVPHQLQEAVLNIYDANSDTMIEFYNDNYKAGLDWQIEENHIEELDTEEATNEVIESMKNETEAWISGDKEITPKALNKTLMIHHDVVGG